MCSGSGADDDHWAPTNFNADDDSTQSDSQQLQRRQTSRPTIKLSSVNVSTSGSHSASGDGKMAHYLRVECASGSTTRGPSVNSKSINGSTLRWPRWWVDKEADKLYHQKFRADRKTYSKWILQEVDNTTSLFDDSNSTQRGEFDTLNTTPLWPRVGLDDVTSRWSSTEASLLIAARYTAE